jgi:predicted DNA-binding transcriptional regulator AlpA
MGNELRKQLGIMSTEEVARSLEVTEHTLAMWRADRKGPDYVRLGRSIFYRTADVQDWINGNIIKFPSEATS